MNHCVCLKERPGAEGEPQESNFEYKEWPYPNEDLKENEVLIKNCLLSVDPAQRCQMNEDTGVTYISAFQIGEPILGLSGVGVVVKSRCPDFVKGNLIVGSFKWPWVEHFVVNMKEMASLYQKGDMSVQGPDPSLALTLLGIAGLTAALGMELKANLKPGSGQTFVVSGAAGSCGSIAGQIARIHGAEKVVGICGTQGKCKWLTFNLGFDEAINYKTENVAKRLGETCPNGIHSYFDNVGGSISDEVIKQMVPNSHIILCGQIADYNKDLPYPPPMLPETERILKENNITRDRFTFVNYPEKFPTTLKTLAEWYFAGKIKVEKTVSEGLENAGKAFVSMMKGGNIGKQIVHIADPY